MTKFSQITPNSTVTDNDYAVGVTAGAVDSRFKWSDVLGWLKAKATWISSSNIDFTTLTVRHSAPDANGWDTIDMGAFKLFFRKVTLSSVSCAANTGIAIATYNFPVGETDDSNLLYYFGIHAGFLGRASPGYDTNSTTPTTSLAFMIYNNSGSTITLSGYAYIYLLKPL